MSANTEVFGPITQSRTRTDRERQWLDSSVFQQRHQNVKHFEEAQIRSLIRRVFFPGWPRPARQVVFSGAEKGVEVATLCWKTAELLSREGAGKVCLVEADFENQVLRHKFGGTSSDGDVSVQATGAVRTSSRQIQDGAWFVSANVFLKNRENAHSIPWLRSRLGELRREFDFAVIHAGPAGEAAAAALLAHLSDGLVLAIDAHRTRRQTAVRIRDQLLQANVRVLGVVLNDRTFPIPDKLYHRL